MCTRKGGRAYRCCALAGVALFSMLLTAGCASHHAAVPGAMMAMMPAAGPVAPRALPAHVVAMWEAEGAAVPAGRDPFNGQIYPKDQLHPEVLSGGKWLSNWSTDPNRKEGAEWKVTVPASGVDVPADGVYYLYARKFWYHGPFRWRFDGSHEWQKVYRTGLLDQQNLSPQVSVSWVGLGPAKLDTGDHTFEVELLKDKQKYIGNDDWPDEGDVKACAFDCFALCSEPVFMQGNPTAPATAPHDEEHWAFQPPTDPLPKNARSPIDLSYLNEDGQGNPVCKRVRAESGKDYFTVDGKPIRFWGVCVSSNAVYLDEQSMDYMGGKLAKAGVNLVRVHAPAFDWNQKGPKDPKKLDPEYVKGLKAFVAAMKDHGIHTCLSIYYPRWFRADTLVAGGPHDKRAYGFLYTDQGLIGAYKEWVNKLLHPDDAGLGGERALLEWEIVNDDQLLSSDVDPADPKGPLSASLEGKYSTWLEKKYGSVDEARQAWNPKEQGAPEGQEKEQPKTLFLTPWQTTRQALAGEDAKPLQARDQRAFLMAQSAGAMEEIRDEITRIAPLTAVAGSSTYWNPFGGPWDPYARYADTLCQVMERLVYWPNPDTQPDQDNTVIRLMDKWTDADPLKYAKDSAIREIQYPRHQHMWAEYSCSMVNRYRTEGVYLASVYGATQGTDAICFFYMASPAWDNTLSKWPVMTPAVFGQFPAFALAFRRGDVKEQDWAVREVLNLANQAGIDVLYTDANGKKRDDVFDQPLNYYVGRVTRELIYGDPNAASTVELRKDLSSFIVPAKSVTTIDGTATINVEQGAAWVNTASFQAAAGTLDQCTGKLTDVGLSSVDSERGCVAVISLDKIDPGDLPKPIATANSVLIQVMSEETNYGWREVGVGAERQVISIGPGPVNVKDIYGTITITRPGDAADMKVTALDPNGYPFCPEKKIELDCKDGSVSFGLKPDVLYYVLERKPPQG